MSLKAEPLDINKYNEILNNVGPVIVQGSLPEEPGSHTLNRSDRPYTDGVVKATAPLSEMPYTWFCLSAVYCALGNSFNLVDDFLASENGRQAKVDTFSLSTPVTPDIPGFENLISGISKPHWDLLVQFLSVVGFQKGGRWWLLYGTEIVFNPGNHPANAVPVTVFTPVSSDVGIYAYLSDQGTIRFYEGTGIPQVDKYASKFNSKAVE